MEVEEILYLDTTVASIYYTLRTEGDSGDGGATNGSLDRAKETFNGQTEQTFSGSLNINKQ
jgi:hypothetical protein